MPGHACRSILLHAIRVHDIKVAKARVFDERLGCGSFLEWSCFTSSAYPKHHCCCDKLLVATVYLARGAIGGAQETVVLRGATVSFLDQLRQVAERLQRSGIASD